MQNRMQDTRLDLEAPLLSVRRQSVPPVVKAATKLEDPAAAKPLTPSWRSVVPFYNSELKSGPFRNPGVVPFIWEQKPGQPKAGPASGNQTPPIPLLPPGRNLNDKVPNGHSRNPNAIFVLSAESIRENKAKEAPAAVPAEEFLEEEDNFLDAVETPSHTEAFFMNCSVSCLSCIPDAVEPSGSFATDPHMRDLMMDRFLPAAQAMTTSLPQCPPRKPPKLANQFENGEHRLHRAPLPYQHRPNFVARYPHDKDIKSFDGDDNEYDDYYQGNRHFSLKACGLLPRLCQKSSFCLLNPMSAMKIGGRSSPSTSRKISSILHSHVPVSQAEDEPWESLHKHKLSCRIPHQGEGGSKSTSKSKQHVQLSDSQTLDKSSSCRSSREALFEIVKRDMGNDKSEGCQSLVKDGERYSAMSSSHESQPVSGAFIPKVVKEIHVDSGMLQGIPHSKHNFTDMEMGLNPLNETSKSAAVLSEVRLDNERMGENLLLEGYNGLVLQPKISGVLETNMALCSRRSAPGMPGQQNSIDHVNSNDGSPFLNGGGQSKNNSSLLHSLLPPPLPKTPSESWLSRTLPSVSAKFPSGQSVFDIHVPQRKQAFHSSSTNPRQESDVKPLESQHPQIPCAVPKRDIPTKLCGLQQCQITLTKSEEGNLNHSETRHDIILDLKPLKPPHRQIRFADVLMTPLSPHSEM